MRKYDLNNREKFDCPSCGQSNKFVKYVDNTTGNYIDSKYGRCDRETSCGYWEKPEQLYIQETESKIKYQIKDLYDSDCLNSDLYINKFHLVNGNTEHIYSKANLNNNTFIEGLLKRFDNNLVRKAYLNYKLGYCFNGSTIFPYYFNNSLKSGKIINFKPDLHRDKDVSPMWLHSAKTFYFKNKTNKLNEEINNLLYPDESIEYNHFMKYREVFTDDSESEKYCFSIPLFGWDLLSLSENKNKTICLVESEKTAIICSIVFPEYVWLASGGSTYLSQYKFCYYNNSNWLILPDLSTNDVTKNKWIESISKIKTKYSMYENFINYLPCDLSKENTLQAKDRGLDIADFILEFNGKCGKYENYIEYMKAVLSGCYEVQPTYKISTYESYCIGKAKEGISIENIPDSEYIISDELQQQLNEIVNIYNEKQLNEVVINTIDISHDNKLSAIIKPAKPVINSNNVDIRNRNIEDIVLINPDEYNVNSLNNKAI